MCILSNCSSLCDVHNVDRLAGQERSHVRHRRLHQSCACLRGGPRNVGSDQAITRSQERVVGPNWLLRHHIEGSTGEPAVVERLGKLQLNDERASSGVDQKGCRLDASQVAGD